MEAFPKRNTQETENLPRSENGPMSPELGDNIQEITKVEADFGDEVNGVVTSLKADIEKLPANIQETYIDKIQRAIDNTKRKADRVIASSILALAMSSPALAGEPEVAEPATSGPSAEQKMEYSYIPSVADVKIILGAAETSIMSQVEKMADDKVPMGEKINSGLKIATTATDTPLLGEILVKKLPALKYVGLIGQARLINMGEEKAILAKKLGQITSEDSSTEDRLDGGLGVADGTPVISQILKDKFPAMQLLGVVRDMRSAIKLAEKDPEYAQNPEEFKAKLRGQMFEKTLKLVLDFKTLGLGSFVYENLRARQTDAEKIEPFQFRSHNQ